MTGSSLFHRLAGEDTIHFESQKRLVLIWFSGSGFLFALLFMQTMLGKYGSEAKDVWILTLPTFAPTFFLIVGTLIADATREAEPDEIVTIDRFFFRLPIWQPSF